MLLNCDCWRRLLRVPWTAMRSKQSILKEISPEHSLEGLMLKLKLQYFGHLMWTDSLEKTLMEGKTDDRRRKGTRGWDGWNASPTQWTWVWASSASWWWTGKPGVLQSMGLQTVRQQWAIELEFEKSWKMYSYQMMKATMTSHRTNSYHVFSDKVTKSTQYVFFWSVPTKNNTTWGKLNKLKLWDFL